jgi:branched-chain amino acid transport system ATP-binding protein
MLEVVRVTQTFGGVVANENVLSIGEVAREVERLAESAPSRERLEAFAGDQPVLSVDGLNAGYGRMQVLHDFHLRVALGQSLCLIGPNGAGKSTVVHAIYGFAKINRGTVRAGGADITGMRPNDKLARASIAYITQDNSVFADMTVEENLYMGGYLMATSDAAREAARRVFSKYTRLAARRRSRVGVALRRRAATAGDLPCPHHGAQDPAGG